MQCRKTVQNETSLSFLVILAVWASLPSPLYPQILKMVETRLPFYEVSIDL